MKSLKKIISVQSNGQVCLGKAFAGQLLSMELTPEGLIMLTPVSVRPKHHDTFFTAEANQQLSDFAQWRQVHPASDSPDPSSILDVVRRNQK